MVSGVARGVCWSVTPQPFIKLSDFWLNLMDLWLTLSDRRSLLGQFTQVSILNGYYNAGFRKYRKTSDDAWFK